MNNLWTVLKATFINDWGLNGFSKSTTNKKEKKKILFSCTTMVIGAIAIGYMITIYSVLMASALESIGFLELLLTIGGLVSTLVVLFTSVYKAQGVLFNSRDYEMLMSLPIKNSTILTSKLINLLIVNWLFTMFSLIPPAVIYFIKVDNLSILYFVILIIAVIFIPLIPVVIASLLALVISYFASKVRYKNLVTILASITLVLLFMISSFKLQSIMEYFIANSTSIMEGIGKIYPPILFLTNALKDVNFIELIKFVAISSISFIIFVVLFSKVFRNINLRFAENYKKANYKMTTLKTSSIRQALIKKEIKNYFSTPMYILNTMIGMILIVVVAGATLFVDGQMLATYLEMPYVAEYIPLNILAILAFGIGLSCTTNSSISLEGKNLWIIKSLPISAKDIFIGKIVLNLIITIPLALIANIMFAIGLKISFIALVWNIIITLVYSILSAILGLLTNLYFPKLDWVSPTVVVKQSASVLITMLSTFMIIALPVGVFIIFKITNISVFLFITLIILILTLIITIILLNTKGIEKFNKLVS